MRLDLHNHSSASYDSSNDIRDYERAHREGRFDAVAITDHNTIHGAVELARAGLFPVIVGQEIDTADGELIGLFLTELVAPLRPAPDTAREIREQGGLVYLQHPFYRYIRRLLHPAARQRLVDGGLVDVVEVANGGPLMRGANRLALELAREHDLAIGAGSDAHHPRDIGRCVVEVDPVELAPAAVLPALRAGRVRDEHRSSAGGLLDRLRYVPRSTRRQRMP